MRPSSLVFLALFALGCSSADGDGDLACGPNGTCPDGYICEAKSNKCIKDNGHKADAGVPDVVNVPDGRTDAAPADARKDAPPQPDGDIFPDARPDMSDAGSADAPVDVVPPTVTITEPASGAVVGGGAQLRYTVSEPSSRIECAFNGGPFADCGSGTSGSTGLPALPDGDVTAVVRATDLAGNQGPPASVTFKLLQTVLSVTIMPQASTCPGTTITFTATRTGATFTCAIDGGAAAACASPFAPPATLSSGPHTLHVIAAAAGETASDSISFAIDATPPAVSITGVTPAPDSAMVVDPSGEISFTSSKPMASARCTLDGATSDCASGTFAYSKLDEARNPHAFKAEVTDSCGNKASRSLTLNVDSTPPKPCLVSVATTGGPVASAGGACLANGQTSGKAGSLTFSGEAGSYRCTLTTDLAGGATPATVPPLGNRFDCGPGQAIAFSALTDLGTEGRPYTLTVEATDLHGNSSSTPLVWLVDTTGPVITLGEATAHPDTGDLAVSYALSTRDASLGVTFAGCSLDGNACTCGQTGALCGEASAGDHAVKVQARDLFGNIGTAVSELRTMTYGPRAGRAILLGFDLEQDSADGEALLGTAVLDVPWRVSGAFDRRPRVLRFKGGKPTANENANVDNALVEIIDVAGSSSISDPSALAAGLRGKDVLVIQDMNDPTAANTTGKAFASDPALRAFLDAGGVVIVLDGSFVLSGAPAQSHTWQVLARGTEPIFKMFLPGGLTERGWGYEPTVTEALFGAPSELFTVQAPAIAGPTVNFVLDTEEKAARVTYKAATSSVVVEKIFPTYDLHYEVSGKIITVATDLPAAETSETQCVVAVDQCFNVNGCCEGSPAGTTLCSCPASDKVAGAFVMPSRSGAYRIETRMMSPRQPLADPTEDESPRPGRSVTMPANIGRPSLVFYSPGVFGSAVQFCYHGTEVGGGAMTAAQMRPQQFRFGNWIDVAPFFPATGCQDPSDVAAVQFCNLGGPGVITVRLVGTDAAGNYNVIEATPFAPECTIIL